MNSCGHQHALQSSSTTPHQHETTPLNSPSRPQRAVELHKQSLTPEYDPPELQGLCTCRAPPDSALDDHGSPAGAQEAAAGPVPPEGCLKLHGSRQPPSPPGLLPGQHPPHPSLHPNPITFRYNICPFFRSQYFARQPWQVCDSTRHHLKHGSCWPEAGLELTCQRLLPAPACAQDA